MKVLIVKLYGCGVNYQINYLSELIDKNFETTKDFKEADAIVMLGGCCCTEHDVYNTAKYINYVLEQKRDDATTYITGCITKGFKDIPIYQNLEREMHEILDFVIKPADCNHLLDLLKQQANLNFECETTIGYGISEFDKIQASIYLQTGCTHNCSFCKSNYLNCELTDMPMEKVKRYIDEFDEQKVRYIQLRGLNICQYGLGLYGRYRLMEICEYVEAKPNIRHLELGGFAFSDAIRMGFADQLKYLTKTDLINGSLESGSDRLLHLMNKGFTMEAFWEFYHQINSQKKKDFYYSIISGFPTETLEDCAATIEVFKKTKPKLVNINEYVDSPHVPSHNLEQLSDEEIAQHTKVYKKALRRNFTKYMDNLQ